MINPRTLTITASNQISVYGISKSLGTTAFTASGLVNGDRIAGVALRLANGGAITVAATVAAGTYAINVSAPSPSLISRNYNITYTAGSVVVNQAVLTVTANPLSITAGNLGNLNSVASFTVSGWRNNNQNTTSVTGVTYSTDATSSSPVGMTYAVTPMSGIVSGAAAANYSITYAAGVLTIIDSPPGGGA